MTQSEDTLDEPCIFLSCKRQDGSDAATVLQREPSEQKLTAWQAWQEANQQGANLVVVLAEAVLRGKKLQVQFSAAMLQFLQPASSHPR